MGPDGAYTVEDAEIAPDDVDSEQSFQEWIDDLGTERAGYTLRCYRLPFNERGQVITNAKGHQAIYLDAFPLDSLNLDELQLTLRRNYMVADKIGVVMPVRCMVFKNGERGVKSNKIIMVQKPPSENDTQNSHKDSFADLMRVFQESSEAQMRQTQLMVAQALQQRAPVVAAVDPMDSFTKMMSVVTGMMAPMMTALAGRPQSAGGGMKETLELIQMVKEVLPDNGGGSDDNGFGGIVKAVAPALGPLLQLAAQNAAAPRQSQTPVAERLVSPVVSKPAAVAAAPRTPTLNEQRAHYGLPPMEESVIPADFGIPPTNTVSLTQVPNVSNNPVYTHLSTLVNFAASGMDPVTAAQEVMKYIPESMDDAIFEFVDDPDCIVKMIAAEPRVMEYQDWFVKLRAEILAAYADPAQEG